MNHNFKTSITIEITLDRSESVMFSQGGRQTLFLKKEYNPCDDNDKELPSLNDFDEVILTIQQSDKGGFDFVSKNAEDAPTRETYEEAKKRMASYLECSKPKTSML